ncbi:FAD/NAD(P)-binding domain-containing protein [Dentipellis sp. KUC8613]|nr:FAD/NAD(P)-binding domain-containing protein [Dentipellis sp. KUC8613]
MANSKLARGADEGPRVIIIGAGLAGIATAIALKEQLKFDRFTIYERSASPGGVWRGCGVDIPAHWYSLSASLNPNWSSFLPSQPEIRAYIERVFVEQNLGAHTAFHTEVLSADWDAEQQVYHVLLEDTAHPGKRWRVDANAVVQAVGGFQEPVFPTDLPGAENFKGPVWHSARWRHDVPLQGKRVAIIGNGCSGAQIVPTISQDPTIEVINFCRSGQWYVPRNQYEYPGWVKWVFGNVPLVMKLHRSFIMARAMTQYMEETAPAKYHKQLLPDYPPGCRRIVVDPSYLASLHRPNVSLEWEAIESIVEDGLKLKSGTVVPVDVIVFGTGFSVKQTKLNIRGSNGQTLQEYYASQGGAAAYLGSNVPGFPNFFTLLGPNSAVGHASVVFMEEVQIQYAMELLKPVIQGKAKSFEVRQDVTARYDAWLQNRIMLSVWNQCHSYYRGDGKDGKNVVLFPGPVSLMWWLARKVDWRKYKAVGDEKFRQQRRRAKVAKYGLLLVLLASGVAWSGHGDEVIALSKNAGEFAQGLVQWISSKLYP